MSVLRRHAAPLTPEAWPEIEDAVRDVLHPALAGRRVVDFDGPHGLDTAAVGLGRLDVPESSDSAPVGYGVHRVQPLVEIRARFELGLWELDNLARGARDVELGPAEKAARDLAAFEDSAIFNGFEPGSIEGLTRASAHEPVSLAFESEAFADAVAHARLTLTDHGIDGPYALVLGPESSRWMDSQASGYPLRMQIAEMIEGDIVYSPVVEGGVLLSRRGGDFEFTVGQDIALGYESHDTEVVRLFLTESFTFRVIEPAAAVVLER